MPKPAGAIRIFTVAGINVFLHWSWALVAIIQIQFRRDTYHNPLWAVAEYLALFAIVLLHEFGHAIACRQVGGKAETIMLWPLGGVAFVQPPQRPGAQLWSIVAGPLVNVLLIAPTGALWYWSRANVSSHDAREFFLMLAIVNAALLVFNLLPVYPLDGGQIFRSLLWFFIGPIDSLIVASLLGMIASAAGLLISLRLGMTWMALMAGYAAWQSWNGFQRARAFTKIAKLPKHHHARCPKCAASPPAVPLWQCDACGQGFDTFLTNGGCPNCGKRFDQTMCIHCGQSSDIRQWTTAPQMVMRSS